MNRKQAIKTVAFLLIFVIMFGYVSKVLAAKWTTGNKSTYVTSQYYDVKDNSIDVCIIGSSQIVYGFSCMAMYDEYGISAYSLGIDNESMLSSYYWLKECEKSHEISTVVLDVSILYEKTRETFFRKALDTMKLSKNKVEAIMARCEIEDASNPLTYLVPLASYHERWKELTDVDFSLDKENSLVYRGNVMKYRVVNSDPADYILEYDEPSKVSMVDYQLAYFRKIVEHCQEEGLNLVLIKTPKKSWNLSKSLEVEKLAKEYSLTFLDFNHQDLIDAAGISFATDIQDEDHLNLRGAEKLSRYVGQYLKDHYELADHRNDTYNPVDMERYTMDRDDSYLRMTINVEEYFDRLDNACYGVIVQMTDDLSGYWTQEVQDQFMALGFTQDLNALEGKGYIGILKGGACVYEQADAREVSYEGAFSPLLPFAAVSNVKMKSRDVCITFEGQPEAFAGKGMNILVYNLLTDKLADKLTIYGNAQDGSLRMVHTIVLE